MRLSIPEQELMTPGHLACQGCGATLAMRYTLKALGNDTILTFPACCWSVIDGPFPYTSLKVPLLHMAFEATGATASGIKAALEIKGNTETTVVGWAGDGGTFDIGLQALSGAAERNEDFIYICYDNEAYMNTGIQRSGATPWGAWTATTPEENFNNIFKKNIEEILAAHRIPYIATASVAYPEDLVKKTKKAKGIKGFRFIHIFAPCPPGWKTRSEDTVKLARLAVQTTVFPLYEIENSEKYTINIVIRNRKPVNEYLELQGRFKHLKENHINFLQENIDRNWERLLKKAGLI